MIPDYQSLMRPVLECARNEPRKISDVVEEISDRLELTEQERQQMLPSGKQTTIANRVHWARSYMKQAGLLRNIRRGWYELTDRGESILDDPTISLDAKYLEKFEEFQEFKLRGKGNDEETVVQVETEIPANTPDENLQSAHKKLDAALAANLLDYVRSASPIFFENLIVDLLIAMGYGGTSEDAGRALGQSGDNGVDGVIDQDPLGVDQIYLQAKRYGPANSVGPGDIRDFYGALSIKKATKGIFVTTSHFTGSAEQTAKDLGSRIVLIDGPQLAKLMIKYNIGCRDKDVLHIKQIDEGYFDEAAD
ncbi:restriction endonuclease [Pseudooceanicola nanhaiensis]|jgi:restriction system protein|uniref:Restriction endonuclease n=2 Tax=Pseudooceanicola nanhaiensis TaxID=375761 RepID=A0A917T0P3_9RHOB|nr:restriction endonuclease [Pseudooceanicola nanhaiensis]GGM05203.1 restriction endonuclease [Pseudooceanicola nanhaiensis]